MGRSSKTIFRKLSCISSTVCPSRLRYCLTIKHWIRWRPSEGFLKLCLKLFLNYINNKCFRKMMLFSPSLDLKQLYKNTVNFMLIIILPQYFMIWYPDVTDTRASTAIAMTPFSCCILPWPFPIAIYLWQLHGSVPFICSASHRDKAASIQLVFTGQTHGTIQISNPHTGPLKEQNHKPSCQSLYPVNKIFTILASSPEHGKGTFYYHLIIKSEVHALSHCLGLSHDTMIHAICFTLFSFSQYG